MLPTTAGKLLPSSSKFAHRFLISRTSRIPLAGRHRGGSLEPESFTARRKASKPRTHKLPKFDKNNSNSRLGRRVQIPLHPTLLQKHDVLQTACWKVQQLARKLPS